MANTNTKKDMRYDDSAERQGRKRLGLRTKNESIDPKHMTPKEYRNFNAGIWDGIERSGDRHDWEAWAWKEGSHSIDRRTVGRRAKQISYKGGNKRKSQRREIDKANHVHENILYYAGLALGYGIVLTLFILVALGKPS